MRTIIGTYSSPLPAVPHKVVRHRFRTGDEDGGVWVRTREVMEITWPKIVEERVTFLPPSTSTTDIARGEDSWHTQKCWVRLFTTVLGIGFTDSDLGYKLEEADNVRRDVQTNEGDNKLSFFGFLSELAYGLIFDHFDDTCTTSPGQRSSPSPAIPQPINLNRTSFVKRTLSEAFDEAPDVYHWVLSICVVRFAKRKQLSSTTFVLRRLFVVCCSTKTDGTCWKNHLEQAHSHMYFTWVMVQLKSTSPRVLGGVHNCARDRS